jgi:putative SOS response-associated peptidase YedK
MWRLWTGERSGKTGVHRLFAFLTTEANEVVQPIHPKAMPMIPTMPEKFDDWLRSTIDEAIAMQLALPKKALKIAARGAWTDGG